jgi:peptidoglycan/xylan/chitin deacetylase (PgdA/CDA1 family)
MKNICNWAALLLLCLTCSWLTWAEDATGNAVVLVYHHVSDDTPKSTSVSAEVFEQHMAYLAKHHTVLPLKTIVETLQAKQPLPNKAVAITFDDGYTNIYQNAHPILKKYAFPYTIFINPALIGKASYQLNWQQVKTMAQENVTFANHGNAHIHSLERLDGESTKDWLERVTKNVTDAETLLTEKVGYSLKYFAYPYGEYNLEYKQHLMNLGYVGFAQHSGAIASHSDFGALPRFPSAGIYSKLSSLKVKLNSLAMPILEVSPKDPEVDPLMRAENFSLTIDNHDLRMAQINCFRGGSIIEHKINQNTLSTLVQGLDRPGRHRINCTAPSKKYGQRYYWFSQPFFVATENGKWLD